MMRTEAKRYTFGVADLRDRISWPYFYWAWGIATASDEEKSQLRHEAQAMLDEWEGVYHGHALVASLPANSDGDDILVGDNLSMCIPMLRQQEADDASSPLLCLADFVRPVTSGIVDRVGAFATTVDVEVCRYDNDPYQRMMAQTLADRLAEAVAECVSDIMPGVRPAVGYPCMPDMSVNFLLDIILDMKRIGIRLTESGMMQPHASVSGLIFAHPQARYFNITHVGDDQLEDYACRRGLDSSIVRRFLKR